MTNEEFIILVDAKLSTYHAKVDAQSCITNAALAGVNSRLDKVNGHIGDLQTESNKRAIVVQEFYNFKEDYKDVPQKIRILEDNQLTTKAVRKWVIGAVTIGCIVGGVVIGIIELIIK